MKVLFTCDLHGMTRFYEAMFESAAVGRCEAVILGGDLLPKSPFSGTGLLEKQAAWIKEYLFPRIEKHRGEHPETSFYLILGNDDFACHEKLILERDGDLFRYLHRRKVLLPDGTPLFGYNFVNLTPFVIKDWEKYDTYDPPHKKTFTPKGIVTRSGRVEEYLFPKSPVDTMVDDLEELEILADFRKTICVFHCPPKNTNLDRTMAGGHVGSQAIRSFFERWQPPLGLHGHIHESPQMTGSYLDRIYDSPCVNPGQRMEFSCVTFDTGDIPGTLTHNRMGPPKK